MSLCGEPNFKPKMMNDKLIKVCGMREAENIREVEQLKVDMIGFIFYPKSPRCLYELPAYMPVKAKRVGVFVNEDKKEIEIFADRFSLDYIQLHGNESPEYCHSLRATGLPEEKTLKTSELTKSPATISCSTPNANNMAAQEISSTGAC